MSAVALVALLVLIVVLRCVMRVPDLDVDGIDGYRRTHFGPVHAQPGFLTVGDPDGRVSPIGFASVNIADVTTARASRATPAVTTAQAALSDAMAARDRECKGGVGKFCRERETAVTERRQAVDMAMRAVEHTADPQTDAAIRVVAWTSLGTLRPTADDFAMLRLVLLALLPQIGGVLLMVGRVHRS